MRAPSPAWAVLLLTGLLGCDRPTPAARAPDPGQPRVLGPARPDTPAQGPAPAEGPEPAPGPAPAPPAAPGEGPPPPPATPARVRLRVVAANVTSGDRQSYTPGHGLRILRALEPDLALVQELNFEDGSPAAIARLVGDAFGEGFHHYREPRGEIPNGIVSRWPIRAAGSWEDSASPNREFAWARIDVPGPRDLWAVSLHLLTRDPGTRRREAEELVAWIRGAVPEPDYLVVGGDLNTRDPEEPALVALGAVVELSPLPRDEQGNPSTNRNRNRVYDYVLPDRDLEAHRVPVELAGLRFADGLVFDTRVFSALEALGPARREDSAAPQMQHMAVAKDFLLPGE